MWRCERRDFPGKKGKRRWVGGRASRMGTRLVRVCMQGGDGLEKRTGGFATKDDGAGCLRVRTRAVSLCVCVMKRIDDCRVMLTFIWSGLPSSRCGSEGGCACVSGSPRDVMARFVCIPRTQPPLFRRHSDGTEDTTAASTSPFLSPPTPVRSPDCMPSHALLFLSLSPLLL